VSASAYQYVSSQGIVYQVTIPDDFALALSMTPATGSEPYLDSIIAPRFATYQSRSPVIARQAVFSPLSKSNTLPPLLSVSGITYFLISVTGETIPAINVNPLSTQSLIQGPPGPQGQAGVGVNTGGTGVVIQNATGPPTFIARTIAGDGTYITASNGTGVSGNPTLALIAGSVDNSALSPVLIQRARASITSAQILALFTTPQLIVAPPGAGLQIVPFGFSFNLLYGGTAYSTTGTLLQITFGTSDQFFSLNQTFLQKTSNQFICSFAQAFAASNSSSTLNKGVFIGANTANPTLGNGSFTIDFWYAVVSGV
jgi:hypothetical protein